MIRHRQSCRTKDESLGSDEPLGKVGGSWQGSHNGSFLGIWSSATQLNHIRAGLEHQC